MNKFMNNQEIVKEHERKATPKSQATREKILQVSLSLFANKGYTESTMRDIAKEAGVSLGLTYRYFARKEELVLALYDQLSNEASQLMQALPKGSLSSRYPQAIFVCLETLEPHRGTLGALFSAGLSVTSSVAVFGENSAEARQKMWSSFHALVAGCTDAPKPQAASQFATMLYAGHLLTILFWLQDRSENQNNTKRLVEFYGKALKLASPFLRMKLVGKLLEEFVEIIEPLFGSPQKNLSAHSS
jgi:AcrR family transcriptional regulator